MWFESVSAWFVALLTTGIPWLNEKTTRSISAENWANKELQHKDRMNGMSEKEILRNAELGRYYIPKAIAQAYPVPHREPDGSKKIIIENCELYREDVNQYGAYQAQLWVKQGKYNLNEAELAVTHLQYEKEHLELFNLVTPLGDKDKATRLEEIQKILASTPWNCRKTEAVLQWQKAHDAESKYH